MIHHLSTRARRVKAIATILDTLRPWSASNEDQASTQNTAGKALIYVWALEQKNSRRGWDEGDEQDVMVPWVMKAKIQGSSNGIATTFNRYYHLYQQGELENDIVKAGGGVLESGYEKDNWWAIAVQRK